MDTGILDDYATKTYVNDILSNIEGGSGIVGPKGEDGADGITPHIGENGNWFIGETDTNVPAQGPTGEAGQNVQSDWNQTDTNALDYINNKPTNIVTSNVAGVQIAVVSVMPDSPDANTLYIVTGTTGE